MTSQNAGVGEPRSATSRLGYLPPLVAFALYVVTLTHSPFSDDLPLVVNNPNLASRHGLLQLVSQDLWSASALQLPTQYYRPLPMAAYWLQVQLLGTHTSWLRLGNLLLFAGTAHLLYRALLSGAEKLSPRVACALAVLWVVHPINTEPVIWLSGRFDLMLGLSMLSSWLCNLQRHRIWSVPVLFIAGLLSKEVALCLPAVLLMQDMTLRRHLAGEAHKYLALAGVLGGYFLLRQQLGVASPQSAIGSVGWLPLVESFARLTATYGQLLALPFGFDVHHWYRAPPLLWTGMVVTGLASTLAWVGYRIATLSPLPTWLGGACLTVASLLPAALIGPNQLNFGDRFAYLGWMGLTLSIGSTAKLYPLKSQWLWVAPTGLLCLWTTATLHRAEQWRSPQTLQAAALKAWPAHPQWRVLQSLTELRSGVGQAVPKRLRQVVEAEPHFARAWNVLCVALLRQGRVDEAFDACQHSTQLEPENPRYLVNLASVLVRTAQWQLVGALAEQALVVHANYAEALYLLALSQANRGETTKAALALERGLSLRPEHLGLKDLRDQLSARNTPQTNAL